MCMGGRSLGEMPYNLIFGVVCSPEVDMFGKEKGCVKVEV